ncbi:MAG: hypothetical protein CL557_17505 [Alphaproteobacteria bacterium]|nr:hypothetical protein [Alphaproteobacteria bacterium]|tara:strand:+ start:2492 stop:4978 length:2487 start_codon:yes stop_codon:yes gene_type:complete
MAKAQFRGYARGKGFQNIDPGYAALDRMREKQREDIGNLKDEQRAQRERDLEAERNLERIHRNEEANRKEIYLEDQVFSTKERALSINRNQVIANTAAELKKFEQKTADLEKITNFSKTAFDSLNKIRKKDWEATSDASYNFYMTHGMSLEDQIRLDLLEDKQWAQGEDLERVADEMKREGYTPEEVMWVRYRNSASDYGRLKAYSVMAGNQFGAWAATKLAEMDAKTPEQKQAALEILQIEYLKAHKLYGLSSDFLSPMFGKMSGARDRILNKAKLDQAIQGSQRRTQEKVQVVVANFNEPEFNSKITGQSILELHAAYTREYKSNGIDTYDNAEARDKTIELFKEKGLLSIDSNRIRAAFAKTPYGDQNTNWYDANKDKIELMIQERERNIKAIKASQELELKAAKDKELDQVERWFKPTDEDKAAGKGWNRDYDVALKVTRQLVANGHDPAVVQDKFGGYLDQSVQTQNDDNWYEDHFNDKLDNHEMTEDDWKDPNLPHSIRDNANLKARWAAETAMIKSGQYNDKWEDRFKSALKFRLNIEDISNESVIDDSYFLALDAAEKQYKDCLLTDKGTPTSCGNEVLADIKIEPTGSKEKDKKIGYGGEDGKSTFGVDDTKGVGKSFFINYSFNTKHPEESPQQFLTLNDKEREELWNNIENDPGFLYSNVVISGDQIKEIETAIKTGKDFKYPTILLDITKGGGPHGHVSELFKVQVELAQKLGILDKHEIDFTALEPAWFRTVVDPEAVNLMKNLQTKADGRKLLQLILNPNSTREPKYMDEGVVKALTRTEPPTTQEMKEDDSYDYLIDPNPYQYGQYAQYTGGE